MKLLVFTQKVDRGDSLLGFFHGWLVELSNVFDEVTVICLGKGEFDLPKNVTVYSLGKERGVSWLGYVVNFYQYLFLIRNAYDRVFVHMNQEYVLLGGLYWKLRGIPVYLWRNHPHGTTLTRIAVLFSTKVFCTSAHSFTARFRKTSIMPVGVDTHIFKPVAAVTRKKYSVCMISRVSPIKHIDLALEAVNMLVLSGTQVSLTIVGSPTPKDFAYYEKLEKYVADHSLSNCVQFVPEVPQSNIPEIDSSHEIYLNLTPSGSFDKAIVEAAACGAIPLVSNSSLAHLLPKICLTEASPEAIAGSIRRLFEPKEQVGIQRELQAFAESQSLAKLVEKLRHEMK